MKVNYINKNSDVKPTGLVCVIDVIRAFTTAAYAFDNGAKEIIMAATPEEAMLLKQKNPEYLLMGEHGGIKIDGFDFGNSPAEIMSADISEKTLVHRTANGTQGVVNNLQADKIIASSFVVAEATYKYIKNSGIEDITFVITNDYRSAEDTAFADYICEKLFYNPNVKAKLYSDIVRNSRYCSTRPQIIGKEDIKLALDIDRFNFAMEITIKNGLPILQKMEIQ